MQHRRDPTSADPALSRAVQWWTKAVAVPNSLREKLSGQNAAALPVLQRTFMIFFFGFAWGFGKHCEGDNFSLKKMNNISGPKPTIKQLKEARKGNGSPRKGNHGLVRGTDTPVTGTDEPFNCRKCL